MHIPDMNRSCRSINRSGEREACAVVEPEIERLQPADMSLPNRVPTQDREASIVHPGGFWSEYNMHTQCPRDLPGDTIVFRGRVYGLLKKQNVRIFDSWSRRQIP